MTQEPEDLWKDWKKRPTPENLSRAVNSFGGMIASSANNNKTVNKALLTSKARLLTSEAIKTYDPSQGTKLSTHVYNHLRPLNREAKDMTEVAPMSRYYGEESGKMVNMIRGFTEENGREPDDVEIRDALGISGRRLEKLNKIVKYEVPESQVVGDVDEGEDPESSRLNLWTEYVYNDLDHHGRKILDMKLGRNGHPAMSNDEISKKLNLSPVEVSNRASKIAQSILDGVNSRDKTI